MGTRLASRLSTARRVERAEVAARALTLHEGEILTPLGERLGNKEIGVQLRVSGHTVKTHLAASYEKLGASNRPEAVANGLRRGLTLLSRLRRNIAEGTVVCRRFGRAYLEACVVTAVSNRRET